MISESCVSRFIGRNIVAIHHEWVLIEEKFETDSVYWRPTERVLKRRWYCKFCRVVEEEKV